MSNSRSVSRTCSTPLSDLRSPLPRPDEPSAWNVLIEGVEALIETGAIPSRDTGAAAVIAWSGVHGIASIVVRRALVGPLDGEEAIDAVLDGIMRAIETL